MTYIYLICILPYSNIVQSILFEQFRLVGDALHSKRYTVYLEGSNVQNYTKTYR